MFIYNNFVIYSYFSAWPSHSAQLAFAISDWLRSLFFTIIIFLLMSLHFCIKSTIKIVVVVEIADICMQASMMPLTKTVCHTLSLGAFFSLPSLLLLINGLYDITDIIGTNVVNVFQICDLFHTSR